MAEQNFAIPNPFAQTALLNDDEENFVHYAGHRTRVTGSGNLDSFFYDLDSQLSFTCTPIAMQSTDADEPDRLANFKGQRVMLRWSTDVIDEVFNITRTILFARTLWQDLPR